MWACIYLSYLHTHTTKTKQIQYSSKRTKTILPLTVTISIGTSGCNWHVPLKLVTSRWIAIVVEHVAVCCGTFINLVTKSLSAGASGYNHLEKIEENATNRYEATNHSKTHYENYTSQPFRSVQDLDTDSSQYRVMYVYYMSIIICLQQVKHFNKTFRHLHVHTIKKQQKSCISC